MSPSGVREPILTLEDIELVAEAEANFDLIMKNGKVYKNTPP